jgi:type VI secretion system FHA domain protein
VGGIEYGLALTRRQRTPTRLGALSTKVFGVHGGSIGRGTDNEWILPDPERYLSGKHARVDFRAGNYVLVDTSSNGTYVNGAQVPLGKYHDYLLKDGDYVRLGEYELLVSIDKSNDFPPDQSAIVAYDGAIALLGRPQIHRQRLGRGLGLEPAAGAQRPIDHRFRRSAARRLWPDRAAEPRAAQAATSEDAGAPPGI